MAAGGEEGCAGRRDRVPRRSLAEGRRGTERRRCGLKAVHALPGRHRARAGGDGDGDRRCGGNGRFARAYAELCHHPPRRQPLAHRAAELRPRCQISGDLRRQPRVDPQPALDLPRSGLCRSDPRPELGMRPRNSAGGWACRPPLLVEQRTARTPPSMAALLSSAIDDKTGPDNRRGPIMAPPRAHQPEREDLFAGRRRRGASEGARASGAACHRAGARRAELLLLRRCLQPPAACAIDRVAAPESAEGRRADHLPPRWRALRLCAERRRLRGAQERAAGALRRHRAGRLHRCCHVREAG